MYNKRKQQYIQYFVFYIGTIDLTHICFLMNICRYSKEKYLKNKDALNQCYPTILDMTGFQNTDDKAVRKTLKMIFEGRIRDGTKLNVEGQSRRYIY